MPILIDGKQVARSLRKDVRRRARKLSAAGVTPGLAVVLVGDHPASAIYVRIKERMAQKAGIHSRVVRLPAKTTQAEIDAVIDALNADMEVHGILVQLPLPAHIDVQQTIAGLDPAKDVDGLHPHNAAALLRRQDGLSPCTPRGILHLLRAYDVPIEGRHAVILGRSAIVGRPLGALLLAANATVTTCHRHTLDSAYHARQADILISAVGVPGLVTSDWVRQGATVIDVGINRLPDGKIVGDVSPSGAAKAAMITPVPGGVGPMTVASLLANTVEATERAQRRATGY